MTNSEKIAALEYRRDKLLKKGFFNHTIAAKIQRKIYKYALFAKLFPKIFFLNYLFLIEG